MVQMIAQKDLIKLVESNGSLVNLLRGALADGMKLTLREVTTKRPLDIILVQDDYVVVQDPPRRFGTETLVVPRLYILPYGGKVGYTFTKDD